MVPRTALSGTPGRPVCSRSCTSTSAGSGATPARATRSTCSTRAPTRPSRRSPSPGPTTSTPRSRRRGRPSRPGRGATPVERSAVLHRLAGLLEAEAEELAQTREPAGGQADPAGPRVRRARHDRQHGVLRRRRPHASRAGHRGVLRPTTRRSIRREPIGVVGSIAPWNYPLQMAGWKVLPAVAAGNTIVLKPSELTPLTTLRLRRAGHRRPAIPDGVVNVVTGTGPDCGAPPAAAPAGRHGLVHRLDPGRSRRSSRPRRPRPSGCTSSSAARRRSWCSTTPTSTPRSRARSPAA